MVPRPRCGRDLYPPARRRGQGLRERLVAEIEPAGLNRLRSIQRGYLEPGGLALRELLDQFAAENPHEAVLQAAIPSIILWAWRGSDRLEPASGRRRLGRRQLAPVVRRVRELTRDERAHPSKLYLAGEVLFQADSDNHLRPAAPIMRLLGGPGRPPGPIRAGRWRARRLTNRALTIGDRFLETAAARDVPVPSGELYPFYSLLVWGAQMLAHAEALVAAVRPRALAIFAPANVGPRALVHAARAAEIPSLYFPHASVLMDPSFNDLPTDFAGLRGPAEVSYYEQVAGRSDRMEVVGDPSLEAEEMPDHDPDFAPVLAPPINPDYLAPVIELVRESLDEPVIVSPHPRADRNLIESLVPDSWEIWTGRTYDLLRRGPPFLMQWTSGVSLEALSLGIPTIELKVPPGGITTYEVIAEPHVRMVSTPDELRLAAAESRAAAADREHRERLCEWARSWSHPRGQEAAERGAALARRALSGPPPGPIWSAWPVPS